MFNVDINFLPKHSYYVCSTGTGLKGRYYPTRTDAVQAMYEYCTNHNIHVECTEDDKHFKKYSNHNGVRFFINRV